MSKGYTWLPIDVNGLRLYQVTIYFPTHPQWNEVRIVAAKTPRHAQRIIEDIHMDTTWIEQPIFTGSRLDVYQPKEWTD